MARLTENDFRVRTVRTLAMRVNFQCSNPKCRVQTVSAVYDPDDINGVANIGVAAHIRGAADGPGSKRYDSTQTPEQRRSIENGIWLCQTCSRLIDTDIQRFPVETLYAWKADAEEEARQNIGRRPYSQHDKDIEILEFLRIVLDRPAFSTPFQIEGNYGDFRRSLDDIITAINTGSLLTRNGIVIRQSYGKSYVTNQKWRNALNTISNDIEQLRRRFDQEVRFGKAHRHEEFYCFYDRDFTREMDARRLTILAQLNSLLVEAGLPTLPTAHYHW